MLGSTEGISLVLGGGGGRGLAHVGGWRALQEQGIRPARVVGSSVGALIGASIAAGTSWQDLVAKAVRLARGSIFSLDARILFRGPRSRGLLRADPLRALIRELVPASRFEQLDIPLSINAVDLRTGEVVWFGEGGRTDVSLADAVYASCALPFLFPPASIGETLFVDGGIIDPLPVQRVRVLGGGQVIAMDLSADARMDPVAAGLFDTYGRVLQILRPEPGVPDDDRVLRIRPPVSGRGTFDLSSAEEMIDGGYRAALEALRSHGWSAAVATKAPPVSPPAREWRPIWSNLMPRIGGHSGEQLSTT